MLLSCLALQSWRYFCRLVFGMTGQLLLCAQSSPQVAASLMRVMAVVYLCFPYLLSLQSVFPNPASSAVISFPSPLFSPQSVVSLHEIFEAMILITKSWEREKNRKLEVSSALDMSQC
jgi:hypothetical protein